METTTTRPKALPPAPPPKPKNKVNGNGSHHQQTSDEEHANNNVDNFYGNNGNHHSNNSLNNNSHHYYPSTPPSDEQVVMTPRGKTSNSTVILIERKLVEQVGDRVHVAGGDHQGIIINKDVVKGERFSVEKLLCNSQCKINFLDQKSAKTPSHLTLEFRVFLKSAKTDQHTQESRILRFWFRDWLTDGGRKAHVAQDFFRELVSPKEFPRGLNARCTVSY